MDDFTRAVMAESEVGRLQTRVAELEALVVTDPLTGLLNRRGLSLAYARMAERTARGDADSHLTVLAVDIDHFKRYNDTYGHAEGDKILTRFAGNLTHNFRAVDAIGRTGGEEFAVVVEGSMDLARRMASRLRRACAPFPKFSGGIASARDGETLFGTLNRADRALYQAKRSGRDKVLIGA